MAQGWSISPAGATINSNGQATFPANGTSSDIVYTITYEDANGCTGNTTYTVPACPPTPCEEEWRISYVGGGDRSNIGFPVSGPATNLFFFSIEHKENGNWVAKPIDMSKVVVTETSGEGGMTSYQITTAPAPNTYYVSITTSACSLRTHNASFELSAPEICPTMNPISFSGIYGMTEIAVVIKPKTSSMPSTYAVYVNFDCDTTTCLDTVGCGGEITNLNNKVRVPSDKKTSDLTAVRVTSIQRGTGIPTSWCQDKNSMTCTHNDTDYIEFEWDTSYC